MNNLDLNTEIILSVDKSVDFKPLPKTWIAKGRSLALGSC